MRKSRAKFKLVLRYCREHVEEMKADACANAVFDKDAKRFWLEVYKLRNVKATTNVNTIVLGKWVIVRLLTCGSNIMIYEQLYSAESDNVTMSAFFEKLTSLHDINHLTGLFSVDDVQTAILQQKSGKAVDCLLFSKLLESSSEVKLWLCTRLFAYWYSNQLVYVGWGSVNSEYFHVLTGVRQGGVLSSYLFRFYARDIIHE